MKASTALIYEPFYWLTLVFVPSFYPQPLFLGGEENLRFLNGPVRVSSSRKNTKQEARYTGDKKIIVMPNRCLVATV